MVINKHLTFYIRNGWPTKIMDAVTAESHIFSPNDELNAVDTIGVGRVMVRAMRYWGSALGIIEESKDAAGITHTLTPLGRQFYERDPYFQRKGSLWLLHRNLARNKDSATAWYWAFNEFSGKEFTKEEFVEVFQAYLMHEQFVCKKPALGKEFDCFKNTYVSENRFDLKKIVEEDTIPFFAPLGLLAYKGNGSFQKVPTKAKDISKDVFYYAILKDNEELLGENQQIGIEHLLEEPGQVGRYFNLSYVELLELLQQLENRKYIRLFHNFGSRYIEVYHTDCDRILNRYYTRAGE